MLKAGNCGLMGEIGGIKYNTMFSPIYKIEHLFPQKITFVVCFNFNFIKSSFSLAHRNRSL